MKGFNFSRVAFVWLSVGFAALMYLGLGVEESNAQLAVANANQETVVAKPSPNDVREFKRLLGDPKIQQWLLEGATQAGGTSAAETGPSVRDQIASAASKIRARLADLKQAAINAKTAPTVIANSWREEMSSTDSLRVIAYIVIFLFVGAGFEWLYAQYTSNRLLSLELGKPDNLSQRMSAAGWRAMITFGSLFAFALGSIGTYLTFDWPPVVDEIVLNVLIIVLVVRVATTISRFFLAPKFKELRLVSFDSAKAKLVHRWVGILAFMGVANYAISHIFQKIASLAENPVSGSAALSVDIVANLVWLVVLIIAIWHIHGKFNERTGTENPNGNKWPIFLTIISIATFGLWLIGATGLMWSVIILGWLFPILTATRHWINTLYDQAEKVDALHGHSANPNEDLVEENETSEQSTILSAEEETIESDATAVADAEPGRYETYRPIIHRLVRFLLVIAAVAGLMLAWGTNLLTLSSSPTLGGRLFEIVIDVIVALLIADLIWVWAKSAIDRRLADYKAPDDGHAPGPEARMATLLPLLRSILMITLLTMVALSILSSFGVNIGPLLAGAGVLGVAIGFGAQALVRDVVSGIFFLIDDAFRIGEYIEIENLRGTVEAMSIRSLRVRHHRGMVHTIPFGELKSLTNHSRDWVIMKLEFRVPFETDLKLVKKLVKKIGAEMAANEDYGHSIIEPPKSQGVRRMEEFNMVVGVKFMTKPGEQWIIRREAYQKVRDAFDANGIVFAERNVKVEVLSDQPLSEEQQKAVVGAAQNAVEPPKGPPAPIPDEP